MTQKPDHGELKRAAELENARDAFMAEYRKRHATGRGVRPNAPMRDEVARLNSAIVAVVPHYASILAENEALRAALAKAYRISIRHDHEITRLVDLQDHLAAALRDNTHA